MSDVNLDPGGYRADDSGSRWLVPLLLGLLALAVIAWILFARPFGGTYDTSTGGTSTGVATVAPSSGSSGTSGLGTSQTKPTGTSGATTGGTTGTTGRTGGTTGGSYGTSP